MASGKVLIVDDEPDIRQVVGILLRANGYETAEAADGAAAVEYMRQNPDVDLLILDIMMPGMDGIAACRAIRQFSMAPTLFLTARTQDADKAAAYTGGGDDYLGKPFSQSELLLKVGSLIRRWCVYRGKEHLEDTQTLGDITVDRKAHAVYKGGVNVGVTDREFEILDYFLAHRGVPVDAKTLYENVWKEQHMPSSTNTVMVHILNLRKKLEDDATRPGIIKTVWGKGYQVD